MSSQGRRSVAPGPQVVVGITSGDRSRDEASSEVRADVRAERSLELVTEAPGLELVRERNLEIVRETVALVRESLIPEPPEAAGPPAASEAPAPMPEPSLADEPVPTPMVHVVALTTPDETSIPPAGDLAAEPAAEQFFSEGDLGRYARAAHENEAQIDEWEAPSSAKAKQKAAPHVVERRARFARYVKWAVAGAAAVCVVAVVRTAIMSRVASVATAPKAVALGAVQAPTLANESVSAAQPKAAAPAAAPVPAAPSVEQEQPRPESSAPAAPPTPDPAAALESKKLARGFLERGKVADAIEAGERSVALDPTDGEAWLLLGAAYQEKGKMVEARRCYAACVQEGKRGPRGECLAMLR